MKEIIQSVLFILFVLAGFSIDVWYGFLVLIVAALLVIAYIRRTRNGN